MVVGQMVYYHPIIGREHTGVKYKIRALGNLHGEPVAWLEGKSGFVAVRALSPVERREKGSDEQRCRD